MLYRFNLNTESGEEVLNWINYDINSQRILGFEQQENGCIVAFLGGASLEAAILNSEKPEPKFDC